ncbi:hypothetical protein NMY22_g12670 [Coprinellus aureogranulatus]|nr:hypothetical protein NMY22_g12670 [Coprinellus aureogranulatus]
MVEPDTPQGFPHFQANEGTSYFAGANNFSIGTQFNITNHNNTTIVNRIQKPDLEVLRDRLQPISDASHLRNIEVSPPNSHCLPGTRKRLIEKIRAWANNGMLFKGVPSHVFWLYGYVGCGKSAIAQTIAQKFDDEKRLAGSFFFFRGAGDRGRSSRFAVTLAWQLAKNIPATLPLIDIARVSCGTTINEASVPTQFEHLFLRPFHSALRSPGLMLQSLRSGPYLAVIDGLDECEDREDIKKLIDGILSFFKDRPRCPLRFFISSRGEEHIRTRLKLINPKEPVKPAGPVEVMDLAEETTDEDIAFVVDESFKNAANHSLIIRSYGDWPSQEDRRRLVKNADKSFIVISVLLKFILEQPNDDRTPLDRLPLALDLRNGLDGLYAEILSRSQNAPHFRDILSAIALSRFPLNIKQLMRFFRLKKYIIMGVLANLCSIIHVPDEDTGIVTLFHTSLREFLCNVARSGDLFTPPSFHGRLAWICFERMGGLVEGDEGWLDEEGLDEEQIQQERQVQASIDLYHGQFCFPHHWESYVDLFKGDRVRLTQELRDAIRHFCGPVTPIPASTIHSHIFSYVEADRYWVYTISRTHCKSKPPDIVLLSVRFSGSTLNSNDQGVLEKVLTALHHLLLQLSDRGVTVKPRQEEVLPILKEIEHTLPPPSSPWPRLSHLTLVEHCLPHLFTVQRENHDLKILFLPRSDFDQHGDRFKFGYVDVAEYSFWSLAKHMTTAFKEDPGLPSIHLTARRPYTKFCPDAEDKEYFKVFKSNFEQAASSIERNVPGAISPVVSQNGWGTAPVSAPFLTHNYALSLLEQFSEDTSVLNLWRAGISMSCIIPSNPDIAGVGVRGSIYAQVLLGFLPAIWALLDSHVSDYKLESLETQSTTNLILAFAILISCGVQALTSILSNYHAYIILCMSWMNNTNAFTYFLLYVHYKANLKDGPGGSPVKPEWTAWLTHVKSQTRTLFHIYGLGECPAAEQGQATGEDGGELKGRQGTNTKKSSAKILFGRIALFMGSLHLTVMAALGVWLWSNPYSFGNSNANCATDSVSLTILGAHVHFTSGVLRIVSLVLYSLFLLPGLNLVLPMTLFLGFFIWHHKRYVTVQGAPPALQIDSEAHGQPLSRRRLAGIVLRETISKCVHSSIFPVCVGLFILLSINIIFVVDIELTLRRNEHLQALGEAEWGFGQVLAVLLLFMPLRDLVEMILARRQRRQEEQIRNHEWNRAIQQGDVKTIVALAKAVANPNVRADDGRTALEVVSLAQDWHGVKILVEAHSDVNLAFKDGRTALHAVICQGQWDLVPILVNKHTDLTSKPPGGNSALELAVRKKNWDCVDCLANSTGLSALEVLILTGSWDHALILLEKENVDVNTRFRDGRTALEVAFHAGQWTSIQALIGKDADVSKVAWPGSSSLEAWARSSERSPAVRSLLGKDPNVSVPFPEDQTLVEVSTGAEDWEGVRILASSKFDVNSAFTDGRTILEATILAKEWEAVNAVIQAGADLNKHFRHEGDTPLRAACDKGAPTSVLHLMLEKGANPNAEGGVLKESPLHTACQERREDVVRSSSITEQNQTLQGSHLTVLRRPNTEGCCTMLGDIGWTPLHYACQNGHAECAQILLEAGADINARTLDGSTALKLACYRGYEDCVKHLLEHGADTSIKNIFGETAFHSASEQNNSVVELLRSYGINE